MQPMKKSYIVLSLSALMFAACKPNIEPDAPSANGLDLSGYVSVGNSLTAGSADGTLYKTGQLYSYSAILAEQFKTVGGGEFKQPLLPGDSGWPIDPFATPPSPQAFPRLVLMPVTNCIGVSSLLPMPIAGPYNDTGGSSANISSQGPFNNVGVPGIRAIDYLFPGYGGINPYARRFYLNPAGLPLEEANRANATFFSMWLGSDDVLGYAISGGDDAGVFDPLGLNKISDVVSFKVSYDSVVKRMTNGGAKGALMNIPDIASLPFFITIPSNSLVLDETKAAQLTGFYASQSIPLSFSAGPNNFVIQDPAAPGGVRKMTDAEMVLIIVPQDSIYCGGWGSLKPMPDRYVLTSQEINDIRAATDVFNAFIQEEASHYNLAYVDMKSYLQLLNTGVKHNGVDYSSNLQTGGSYSLDGLHPSKRGNALIANQIINAINAKYGSSIPTTDVNKYPAVGLP
jgi:hypothetical protein